MQAKTVIKKNPGFSSGSGFKRNSRLEEEMTSMILDSYNVQMNQASLLRQKTARLMHSAAYRSHKKESSLDKILDRFLDSSHRLLEECTSEIFDLYIENGARRSNHKKGNHESTLFFNAVNTQTNTRWMEDWINQVDFLNDKTNAFPLEQEGGFGEYTGVTASNSNL